MAKLKKMDWRQAVAILIVIVSVLAFAKWYWYSQYYMIPKNVFWGAIDQNFQTGYITKIVKQQSGQQVMIKQDNLQFRGSLLANSIVTLQNNSPNNKSLVVTQTIGTTMADYLKYDQIDGNNKNKAVNVWAVGNNSKGEQPRILNDALVSSPIMFGYLNTQKRQELIKNLRSQKVFDVDFGKTDTKYKIDGRRVYAFDVNIKLSSYIKIYSQYLKDMGQDSLAQQMSNAAIGGTLKATIYINPASRQMVRMQPKNSDIYESYSNFGLSRLVEPPKNVKLSIARLQQELAQ